MNKGKPDEIALIENLQRENLSPLEEAEALARLKRQEGYTDEQLAKVVGKSRQAINDSLLLNKLPEDIKTESRTSGIGSKSQLLQVVRAHTPEKVQATWASLSTGETPTVRQLRRKTAAKKMLGRPKHFSTTHVDAPTQLRITIAARKVRVAHEDIRNALRRILKHYD